VISPVNLFDSQTGKWNMIIEKGQHMNTTRNGFTLIEMVVVIMVIGVLAAMVVPKFAGAHTDATVVAAGEDILAMTQALENHKSTKGFWPVDTATGVSPPEITANFKGSSPFEKPCPIGSAYDYDNQSVGSVKVITIALKSTIALPGPTIVDAQALDEFIDDGVLNTGRFRSTSSGSYVYRISD